MLRFILIFILLFPATALAGDKEAEKAKSSLKTPLKKLLDMMKDVESRLNDADTGAWTQDEQRSIVEALKLQKDAKSELDELIEKIQNGGSSTGAGNKPGTGSGKSGNGLGKPKQEKSFSEQSKEKENQSKSTTEKQNSVNGSKNKPKPKDQRAKKDKAAQDKSGKIDKSLDAKKKSPWGNLPQKLHQDVERARKQEVPEKWRDLIDGYRKRING